jgi:hypothetical protein
MITSTTTSASAPVGVVSAATGSSLATSTARSGPNLAASASRSASRGPPSHHHEPGSGLFRRRCGAQPPDTRPEHRDDVAAAGAGNRCPPTYSGGKWVGQGRYDGVEVSGTASTIESGSGSHPFAGGHTTPLRCPFPDGLDNPDGFVTGNEREPAGERSVYSS